MGRRKGSKNTRKENAPENERRDTKKQTYLITINNPTGDELDPVQTLLQSEISSKIRYIRWALEEGEENKVPHIHIALFLKEQERFSAVKKIFPRCRIEDELFGSNQQLIDYIGNPEYVHSDKHHEEAKRGKKKGGICTAKGEYGSTQGIRMSARAEGSTIDSRLLVIQDAIKAGKTMIELYEIDFPVVVKYSNQLNQYKTLVDGLSPDDDRRKRIADARRISEENNMIYERMKQEEQRLQAEINDEIAYFKQQSQ
jgi:hypothetical protein